MDAGTDVTDVAAEAASLARHTQAVLQGAFVVSKAANDPAVARQRPHLRHYFEFLFHRDQGADHDRPEPARGMHQLSPHLVCDGAADAIDFYVARSQELMRLPGETAIMHAS